ncbi:hypothetical protein CEXT_669991 [Caerostris extrusa]|uniref:TIR domain-containing protein n=1 Tax=Caerostris extrusa TaxID=172846 RepID=A0AAV4NXI3_CAEEX|nr:hypothetical protein CEXT_669991 [Caerostris extrusa]
MTNSKSSASGSLLITSSKFEKLFILFHAQWSSDARLIREWKCALEKNLHLNRRQVFLPVIGIESPGLTGTYAQRL